MNEATSRLFAQLTNRGLTSSAAGVILGATLQQNPPATQKYKQDVLSALFILQRQREAKQEAELREIINLLGLSDAEVNAAADQAMQAVEAKTND